MGRALPEIVSDYHWVRFGVNVRQATTAAAPVAVPMMCHSWASQRKLASVGGCRTRHHTHRQSPAAH